MELILNGKKRPILAADADHHRSRITCLGLYDLGRTAILGSGEVPGRRLASPLDSGVANREAMVSANKAEDAGFRAHSIHNRTKLVTFASYR
jgi:hypothetical protein